MQTYAVKMHNFLRFGETNNTIVFDLSPEQKQAIKDGTVTMDQIYEELRKDPVTHVRNAKNRGIANLIGIKGVIDNDPNMSNGAGKSTVLEAICYVRYDRIIRKTANTDKIERAGTSVVRKINGEYPADLKESYVEEFLESDGRIYRIKRGRTFAKGHKNHTPILEFECVGADSVDSLSGHRTRDTKQAIEEIITMDYDLFVNSQMFGQNDAGKILIGTDKVRKEMLISLLHVENVVQGCLERIRVKKNERQKKVDGIRNNISLLENNVVTALKSYLSEEEKSKAEHGFSSEYPDLLLKIIEQQKNTTEKTISDVKTQISSVDKKIEDLSKSDQLVVIEKLKEEGRTVKRDRDAKAKAKDEQLKQWKEIQQENERLSSQKKDDKTKKQARLSELKAKQAEKSKAVQQFNKDDLAVKLKKCQDAKALKPSLSAELDKAKKQVNGGISTIADFQATIRQRNADISKLKKQLENIQGDAFICPECKSNVNRQHILVKIDDYTKEKESIEAELKAFAPSQEQAVKQVSDLEAKLQKIVQYTIKESEIQAQFKSHEEDVKRILELQGMLTDLSTTIESLDKEIESLGLKAKEYETKCQTIEKTFASDLEQLSSKLAVIAQKYKDAQKDAESILVSITNLKAEKVSLENKWSSLSKHVGELAKEAEHQSKQKQEILDKTADLEKESQYLNRLLFLEDVYGLDGVQTRIIKKYLPLLNVYIKEFLDVLSRGQMTVKFEINDRSKVDMKISGGTADSFDLLSGGEKMITRLAVDIALTLLSFSRSSQKPEMICLDEIFGPLDMSHTSGVFKVLQKLKDKFDRVIIISHRSEIQDLTDNNIVVEKDSSANGISIIRGFES